MNSRAAVVWTTGVPGVRPRRPTSAEPAPARADHPARPRARRPRRGRPDRAASPPGRRDAAARAPPAYLAAVQRRAGGAVRRRARAGHRRQPDLPRDARGQRADRRRLAGGGPGDRRGPGRPGGQHRRRPAPRDARPGRRVLRLQRRRGGDLLAARPRRRPDRLRRRRRPPRRRRAGRVLRRPAGADDLPAPAPADAVARHRIAGEYGGAGRRARGQRPAAARHRRPGWLRAFHAVVPAALARVQAGGPGHPVRRGHPPGGPAGQPGADRRRPAGDLPRRCATLADDSRRTLARPRRRRIRAVRVVPRAWTHLLATVARPATLDPRRPRARGLGAHAAGSPGVAAARPRCE